MTLRPASSLHVSEWLNTSSPVSLDALRGRVVMIEVFQMLCPGCVSQGLPQAQRIERLFGPQGLVVLGLHSVFEHHEAQGSRDALEAFLHEYRIRFPVGIDEPAGRGGPPRTMQAYALQGTPTTLLIDARGRVRKKKFGVESDLAMGAEIMALLLEADAMVATSTGPDTDIDTEVPGAGCTPEGCALPAA
ncbi:MAG: TlpA disulfide reductase family protein [Pseudomonadota bacterium]